MVWLRGCRGCDDEAVLAGWYLSVTTIDERTVAGTAVYSVEVPLFIFAYSFSDYFNFCTLVYVAMYVGIILVYYINLVT